MKIVVVIVLIISSSVGFAFSKDKPLNLVLNEYRAPPAIMTEEAPLNQISRYGGKRISLSFQNIKIRTVLQLLAEFRGINMVVSDKVKNDITLRLNNIPWDQALDVILTTQNLGQRRKGNVLLIDTKEHLGQLEKIALENRTAIDALEPLHSELLQINYAKAAEVATLIKDKKNSFLSKKGSLSVDARTNTVWIQDTWKKIKEVKTLIQRLDIPVKQVQIEARIVEVSKDFSQDLGIKWSVSRPGSELGEVVTAINQNSNLALRNQIPSYIQKLNLDLVAVPLNAANPAALGIALAKLGDNIMLDLELSALESEGRAELISSPRLITVNQQAAVIESGKEIPYQESTASGATSVAFKKAVLSLKVTPQITPDNKILTNLQINQDIASPAETYNGVPVIVTKEIQTTVLVNNGQTLVLGGIYKHDKSNMIKRIPFFGELPVVGGLFRNTRTVVANEELLIFITPKIITYSLAMAAMKEKRRKV